EIYREERALLPNWPHRTIALARPAFRQRPSAHARRHSLSPPRAFRPNQFARAQLSRCGVTRSDRSQPSNDNSASFLWNGNVRFAQINWLERQFREISIRIGGNLSENFSRSIANLSLLELRKFLGSE